MPTTLMTKTLLLLRSVWRTTRPWSEPSTWREWKPSWWATLLPFSSSNNLCCWIQKEPWVIFERTSPTTSTSTMVTQTCSPSIALRAFSPVLQLDRLNTHQPRASLTLATRLDLRDQLHLKRVQKRRAPRRRLRRRKSSPRKRSSSKALASTKSQVWELQRRRLKRTWQQSMWANEIMLVKIKV